MTHVRGHNGMDQAIRARPNIAEGPYDVTLLRDLLLLRVLRFKDIFAS
jgi:hypothetical protein